MKRVKRYAPFYVQEMTYIESYLEEMAAKGMFLKKWSLLFAEFECGEAKAIRYRVVPKAVDKEEKQIFAGSGWKYVCRKGPADEFSIFCTDDEQAPELFTDMGSYAIYMKKFKRACALNILMIPIMLFIWWKIFFADFYTEGPAHAIEYGILGFYLLAVTAYLWWIMFLILNIRMIIQIKRSVTIRHDKSYKKPLFIHKVIEIALYIVMILAIFGVVSTFDLGPSREAVDQPVSFAEYEPATWQEIQYALDNDDWSGQDLYYETMEDNDLLIKSSSIDAETSETIYSARYYEFCLDSMAEQWLKEEIAYDLQIELAYDSEIIPKVEIDDTKTAVWKSGLEKEIQLSSEEVDYIGYYEADGYQKLYIRDGKRIEAVGYSGNNRLLDNLDLFINDIKE